MALMKCEDCGKDVSTRAVACPNCGCPIEELYHQKVPENKIKGKQGKEENNYIRRTEGDKQKWSNEDCDQQKKAPKKKKMEVDVASTIKTTEESDTNNDKSTDNISYEQFRTKVLLTINNFFSSRITPNGKLGRLQFIFYWLGTNCVYGLIFIFLVFIWGLINPTPKILMAGSIIFAAFFLVKWHIFLTIKRFHDLGRSGWETLTLLIPIYDIYIFMLLLFKPGKETKFSNFSHGKNNLSIQCNNQSNYVGKLCNYCNQPYNLREYDLSSEHIYCSYCKHELPKS